MDRWKDPKKELPDKGRIVACLYRHWKEIMPQSYEVMFGEVVYPNNYPNTEYPIAAQQMDETGQGSWMCFIGCDETYSGRCDDVAVAWMYADDFEMPEWI